MQPADLSGNEIIRVLVADDTRIHTQLLAEALRRDRHLEIINPPARLQDFAETVRVHKVEVIVLSSNLEEEPLRGFELLRQLRAADPGILAIMLLDSSRRETVLQAFRAGARGIFSRLDSLETLSKCIRSVRQGQIWANGEQMAYAVEALAASPTLRAVDANGLSLLSKREMDVVRSLAEGLTNREIAERLGLSQHTIKNYLFRVYDKLGVSSRLELLFMTLTQAGAPRVKGQPLSDSLSREREDLPGLKSAAGHSVNSRPAGGHEKHDSRFSPIRRKELKGEAHDIRSEEQGPARVKGSPALTGPDPLG